MQPTEHSQPDMTTKAVPLNDAQRGAIKEFVAVADTISAALAKDDLAQFNKVGPNAMPAVEKVVGAFKDRSDLADILKHLSDSRHLHAAQDLAAARKAFHPFSNAASRLLELLGKSNAEPFELFECPMVDQAIPGVPKKGRWVQAAGRTLANPYFGADMLDCGAKVKL